MARTVRGGQVETRSARLRLEPRPRPYWRETGKPGLHLGYRRLEKTNGSWIVRRYQGSGGMYETKAFAQADDYADSDGQEILTYHEAMHRLAGEAPPVRHGSAYTVRDAVTDYLVYLQGHRKTEADARSRLDAYVTGYFGDRPLSALTADDFDAWLKWALTHKPSGRLKDGKQSAAAKRARAKAKGKTVEPPKPEVPKAERDRRRKSTLNRVINYLKAALERAADRKRVSNRDAWSQLQKFKGADNARLTRLTTEEARRLLNVCEPDFRQLVEAALLTGCRYGELTRLRARDYDSGSATVLVAESKSAKPRRVPLNDEGKRFFEALTAAKQGDDILLTKGDGTPWAKSEQFRRINAACKTAKITPAVNFHAIRHTFASLLVEAGTPLAFVAEALGHSDTRMVSKHYSHLAPNIVHDAIRANLPTFGVRVDDKVRKMRP
jgi:integrase